MADNKHLPKFDDLPLLNDDGVYPGCAWGVWGPDDELGTINLLTEKVVAEAAKEIKWVVVSEYYTSHQLTEHSGLEKRSV